MLDASFLLELYLWGIPWVCAVKRHKKSLYRRGRPAGRGTRPASCAVSCNAWSFSNWPPGGRRILRGVDWVGDGSCWVFCMRVRVRGGEGLRVGPSPTAILGQLAAESFVQSSNCPMWRVRRVVSPFSGFHVVCSRFLASADPVVHPAASAARRLLATPSVRARGDRGAAAVVAR